MIFKFLSSKVSKFVASVAPLVFAFGVAANIVALIFSVIAGIFCFVAYNQNPDRQIPEDLWGIFCYCLIAFFFTMWFWSPILWESFLKIRDEYSDFIVQQTEKKHDGS